MPKPVPLQFASRASGNSQRSGTTSGGGEKEDENRDSGMDDFTKIGMWQTWLANER
jgi:hypothetical protein